MRIQKFLRYTLISSFALASIFFVGTVNAQTKAPACENTIWVCPTVIDRGPDYNGYHTLDLSATGLPTTDDATGNPLEWNVVCGIDSPQGDLYSSNDPETDRQLCLAGNLEKMQKTQYYFGRQFTTWDMDLLEGTVNPQTSTDGSVTAVVRPHSLNTHNHTCWFVAHTGTGVVGDDSNLNVNPGSGEANTLVYATFIAQSTPASCISVRADPYGRTFNEELKPVPGATVSSFDFASKSLIKLPGLPNPVQTNEDGLFNFNIEPGTSFLRSNLTNADVTTVHANAALAYSNLYTYDEPIVETLEKPEQRDIPVIGGNAPILKLMSYSNMQFGTETRLEGRASWPLTIIDVLQGTQSIVQQSSDEFGGFSFFIDNAAIDPTQKLTIKLTEVDLLSADTSVPAPNAEVVEEEVDPIPTYIEGFAYDAAGAAMPFATVQVKLTGNDALYYETKADGKGFFSIGARYLPILPYYLAFAPANQIPDSGNTIEITIPEFIQRNKEHLDIEQVDVMLGTKKGTKVDPSAYQDSATRGGLNDRPVDRQIPDQTPENQDVTEATTPLTSSNLLMILVIIFIGGAFVFFMLMKKRYGGATKDDAEKYTKSDEPEPLA